jgi:hypothetical protein
MPRRQDRFQSTGSHEIRSDVLKRSNAHGQQRHKNPETTSRAQAYSETDTEKNFHISSLLCFHAQRLIPMTHILL